MTEPKVKQKKHATVGNPTINAVLKSLFRFATQAQALDRIDTLKAHFVTSTHVESPNSAAIWVRGYALTEEEIKQGFTGNYALISCVAAGDKFTLQAVKLASELRFHPQRKRLKQSHPDWGHPILRDIKKKRVFDTIEEAANELRRLHEEFPDISIPDEHRLLLIVYEKLEGVKSPVQKYKFEVKGLPPQENCEACFMIDFKLNQRPLIRQSEPSAARTETKGYFTSMVKLKKKKKPVKPTE